MNQNAAQSVSLWALAGSLVEHRQLLAQMIKREVEGRYKGTIIGLAWSFFYPLLMLAVYTFVFSVVFKARWGGGEESKVQFALVLFIGLIVHGIFAEVVNRAPGLVLANANYVKRVVFPLEILPVVSMGGALFHAAISLCVLLLVVLVNGHIYWTVIFAPLVIMPLVFMALGFSWMLASLGVFLRDVGQTINIVTMIMLFLSPVFYPITSLPEEYRIWMMLNPLTFIVEQVRQVVIWGRLPDWSGLCIYTMISVGVLWIGFAWFQKTRKGFADVI